MLRVGLTGNIGSGKTVVSQIFSKLGVPVFHADFEARKLFDQEETRERIRELFGIDVFSNSGEILRPKLAELVFNDQSLLYQLNSIIHPAVRQQYQHWCLQFREVHYTLYEAAILFESGHYLEMDKVICVTAPEELRISRVMERDHVTREDVQKRISNQWTEERKVALADFVIRNDGSELLIEQVMEAHRRIVGQLESWTVGRLDNSIPKTDD
jgi:dephospho-CoA kinase